VLGVSIVERRRRAWMTGAQRFDQRGIISDERQRGWQWEPILSANEARGIRELVDLARAPVRITTKNGSR
jgi:hypothetical protein